MANNTAAWIAEHAADYAHLEAARVAAARKADIAELRGGYTVFVQQFATAAERDAIDAAFAALETLEGDAYDEAFGALDVAIDEIDARADAERAARLRLPGGVDNALALAFDGWINSQAIAARLAA